MITVITGDLMNSQELDPEKWLPFLKGVLERWGNNPEHWEIYRGDSFQLILDQPAESISAAILLKAGIKMMSPLDLRVGIGIGERSYTAEKVTESNGSAFVRSGETFENLKKLKQEIAIKSPWEELDQMLNMELKLVQTILQGWTTNAAEAVFQSLNEPGLSQEEQGVKLGITQHAFSTRLKRAHFEVIRQWLEYVSQKIAMQV
jgi:hypothetical protein